jgi:hypothetical protein
MPPNVAKLSDARKRVRSSAVLGRGCISMEVDPEGDPEAPEFPQVLG